jgi:hypothetical protein
VLSKELGGGSDRIEEMVVEWSAKGSAEAVISRGSDQSEAVITQRQ